MDEPSDDDAPRAHLDYLVDSWSERAEKSKFVPPYPPKQLDALLRKINILEIDDEELREIGHRLFLALSGSETPSATHNEQPGSLIQAILRGSIQRTLRQYGTIALTLSFAPGCEELMRYPWELLYNREHFLLASGVFTLTRTLVNPEMPTESELPVSPPIRLLYIGASPIDRPSLETGRRFEALKRGLARLIEDGNVFVDRLWPPTFDELVRYLDSFGSMSAALDNEASISCYVVHFDGHGASGRLCPAGDCDKLNNDDARRCADCGMSLDHVTPQTYLRKVEGTGKGLPGVHYQPGRDEHGILTWGTAQHLPLSRSGGSHRIYPEPYRYDYQPARLLLCLPQRQTGGHLARCRQGKGAVSASHSVRIWAIKP